MNNPKRSRDLEAVCEHVPLAQRHRLFTFRATHPYSHVTSDDVIWRYVACGEGEKVLLFLSGAFLKADMWFNQILALEESYRIIAPDAYPRQGIFDPEAVVEALVRSPDA